MLRQLPIIQRDCLQSGNSKKTTLHCCGSLCTWRLGLGLELPLDMPDSLIRLPVNRIHIDRFVYAWHTLQCTILSDQNLTRSDEFIKVLQASSPKSNLKSTSSHLKYGHHMCRLGLQLPLDMPNSQFGLPANMIHLARVLYWWHTLQNAIFSC